MARRLDCPDCERDSPCENHGWICTKGSRCIEHAAQPSFARDHTKPMTAKHFAAWLVQMRALRDWKQTDCARALGVDKGQVSRWKTNGAPAYIALAIAAIMAGLPAWKP